MSDDQDNALVPAPEPTPARHPLAERADRPVLTNIPETAEYLPLLVAVNGRADKTGRNMEGETFLVRHYYAHVVDRMHPETGEISPEPRLVLFTPEGQSIACSGRAVLDAMATIIRIVGNKPFDPPLRVRVNSVQGGGGFPYHTLSLLSADSSGKKGK